MADISAIGSQRVKETGCSLGGLRCAFVINSFVLSQGALCLDVEFPCVESLDLCFPPLKLTVQKQLDLVSLLKILSNMKWLLLDLWLKHIQDTSSLSRSNDFMFFFCFALTPFQYFSKLLPNIIVKKQTLKAMLGRDQVLDFCLNQTSKKNQGIC